MSVRLKKNKLNFYFLILFISKSMLFSAENSLSVNLIQNNSKNNFWWIEKNNYGINPYNNYLYTTFNRNHKKVSLKINLLLNSSESQWGESFLNFNVFNHSHLKIGTYYRDFSTYLNDELSSGHMLISNNAEPIPKIGFKLTFSIESKGMMKKRNGMTGLILDGKQITTMRHLFSPILFFKATLMNYYPHYLEKE